MLDAWRSPATFAGGTSIALASGQYESEQFVLWRVPITGGTVDELFRIDVRPDPNDSESWRRFGLGNVTDSYAVVVDLANGSNEPARLWRLPADG